MIRIQSPEDVNELRRMVESGLLKESDLNTMNIKGGYVATQPPMGQQAQQKRRMRVVGFGNGQATDLGEEDATALPVDYTRPGVDIPGIGKGRYTADGRYAVVANPDGSQTKVVLGYDAEGSDRLNARALARQKVEADIRATEEGIASSQAARTTGRVQAPQWSNDLGAWVLPPSAQNPTGRVIAPEGGGGQGNMNKATEDEKRSAGLAIRMDNAIKAMESKPEGQKPQVIPEVLRAIPLVGEPLANAATPYERQTVEAAQLDALDAALTLATGAAYTKEQLKGLAKSYFPQLGDEDKTIEDKRARLQDVIQTARIRAGRASGAIDANAASKAVSQSGPKVGAMKEGRGGSRYVFTGGDQYDSANWKKIK